MNTAQLEKECHTYSAYLIGRAPGPYVIGKYVECHAVVGRLAGGTRFDSYLIGVSARGPFWARLADVYAGRFRKFAVLRRKLVLMVALLECAPSSFEYLDRVDRAALFSLAVQALSYAAVLPLATLRFLPVHVWMVFSARERH